MYFSLVALAALLLSLVSCLEEFDLDAPSETNTSESRFSTLSRDSLRWGPYRSGSYLGIRPRFPRSLILGLLWFNADTLNGFAQIRNTYEQHDSVSRANWIQYDPRLGGRQVIRDDGNHVTVTVDFVKSSNGRNWGVSVKAVPHPGYESLKTSFVWYSGLEGEKLDETFGQMVPGGLFKRDTKFSVTGYTDSVEFSGMSEELGLFNMKVTDMSPRRHPAPPRKSSRDADPRKIQQMSLRVPDGNVWKAGDIFIELAKDSIRAGAEIYGDEMSAMPPHVAFLLRNTNNYEGNLHFVQLMYEGTAEFNVVFNEGSTPPTEKIDASNIENRVKSMLNQVKTKFEDAYDIAEKHAEFGHELLSGLLGGLSYFHGDHLVDRETSLDDEDLPLDVNGDTHLPALKGLFEGPHELLTLVPSRPFFPRGFYWDEGFHLLPLLPYDSDLALEIIQSWFDLIDDDGWIAREQILGLESRARVPKEFTVQSSAIVNPPTLMLAFAYLLDFDQPERIKDDLLQASDLGQVITRDKELLKEYAALLYPKFKSHYEMFRRSQAGETDDFDRDDFKEAFRWRGRTTTHCLASGLDDYPRALPLDTAELNVDLLSWIGVMTRSVKRVAEVLELDEDVQKYEQIEKDIIESIELIHWSDEHQTYCDVTVDDEDANAHFCAKGYISLFPFLTKLISPNDFHRITSTVKLIADPNELWSEFGIRSVSKADKFYRTGENYWRSPIWMNINYLVVENLKYYHDLVKNLEGSEELLELLKPTYSSLRANLINNVKSEWERTGFVWENYDDMTGEARGAKNFLGWSSLVLLLMQMPEELA